MITILKLRNIKELVIAINLNFFSVLLYYIFFDIDNGTYMIAFFSSIFRALTMVIVLEIIEYSCKGNYLTGGAFLLYTTVIYNSISVIKYSVDYFYTGGIDDNLIRILGSLFIDLVIIVSSIIFRKYHRYKLRKNKGTKEKGFFTLSLSIAFVLAFIYAVINISYFQMTQMLLTAGVSRTAKTFVNALIYVVYASSILCIKERKGIVSYIKSFLPVLIIGLTNIYISMLSGKKNIIVVFAVVVICGMLYTDKIHYKFAKFAAFISPIVLQVLQIISVAISGRDFFSIQYQLRYQAFRFDLSDLAITIASRYENIENPIGVITEAISYSIPSIIKSGKVSELVIYKAQMGSVNLVEDFDFNDTFFSMGAQVGGFLGIFTVFISIMLFFEWVSWKIINIKIIGSGMIIVLIPYFATCESGWSMFVYQTRDMIIYAILAYLIFKMITVIKIKI